MEEIFENKTTYSQKEYEEFLKSYEQEYSTSENMYAIFYLIFFGLCMVMAFKTREIILGIILFLGLLVYLWYKIIRPSKLVEKNKKSEKMSGNFVNNYKFYKYYFKVDNPDGKAQLLYFKLYRVVETNTHFYIYISREFAFIISKEGFTKGSAEEFSKFVKKKVFTKYKNRVKKV